MKNITFGMIAILFIGVAACSLGKSDPQSQKVKQPLSPTPSVISGNYLGSMHKGNFVWGGAMNLTWNELCDNILHEKLALINGDKVAKEMADKLNSPVFTKSDLDDESYYIKSGYGQQTVDAINKECRKKFPKKSFEDLDLILAPSDIISYSYLLKEVAYLVEFEKKTVKFMGENVKGFYAQGEAQAENIEVLQYENEDKFIIKIHLKNDKDELLLAKGYNTQDAQGLVSTINSLKQSLGKMSPNQVFEAPDLHFIHARKYDELIGKNLANKGFEKYRIAEMYENIAFDMDNKGARVENEAVIVLSKSAPMETRKFILDKPYWVVMRRTGSTKPYFLLGVNNTQIMTKY